MKEIRKIWSAVEYKGIFFFVPINDPDKTKEEYVKEKYNNRYGNL